MPIVEQSFYIKERTSLVRVTHPSQYLFQVFVKGRLQDSNTYKVCGDTVDFGFDCLVPGDCVQLFFFIP